MKNQDIVEIYPNIYQIAGRSRAGHAYVVRGLRRNVLIDTGLPGTTAHVERCLAAIGLRREDIGLVILTQAHIDHCGGVPFFAGPALIAAHRLAADKIALLERFEQTSPAADGAGGAIEIDIRVEDGTTVDLGNFELHLLHTPGHCSGALCVYEPNHRLLFSGDTIMAGGALGLGNVSDHIDSLKRLANLRVELLYPGHGRISTSAESDIRQGIARLQDPLGDAKALFDAMRHSRKNLDAVMRSLREPSIK